MFSLHTNLVRFKTNKMSANKNEHHQSVDVKCECVLRLMVLFGPDVCWQEQPSRPPECQL